MSQLTSTQEDTATEVPGVAFLTYVLSSILEHPEALSIEATTDAFGIFITVRVSEDDMGKLIGKGGQTVKALKTLLRIIGGNAHQRINLKVIEPSSLPLIPNS